MAGETGLILDANKPITGHSTQPLCIFMSDNIAAAIDRLRDFDTAITSGPEDIGSVIFVTFKDPDGNPLMICQRK